MSRGNKGQTNPMDLLLVAMVFFIGLGLFLFMDFLATKDMIISKQTIYLSMDIDDSGSEMASLLRATSGGKTHMEILGDMSAQNYNDFISSGVDGLSKAAESFGQGYQISGLASAPAASASAPSTCVIEDSGSYPGKMFWPMQGTRVSDEPGWRIDPVDKSSCNCHRGVDIAGGGLEVLAAANGTVSEIQRSPTGYGNLVKLSHDGGYETWYGHLREIRVENGQKVEGGKTVIGISGSSGKSTGPHLHFELRRNGVAISPCRNMENAQPGCLVNDRCSGGSTETTSYLAQVPVPGAQPGNIRKTVEMRK